jgi:sigma-B regulation protein RsbQ
MGRYPENSVLHRNSGEHYMSVIRRNNIRLAGTGDKTMIFAHGFGCDQNMWRFVAPAFQHEYRTVLFDHVGAGGSDLSAYRPQKYASLQGYADDVIEICGELALVDTVFVGHSVSAMIGVLAAIQRPELFDSLVLIGPSPCYLNDGSYFGGFNRSDIDGLLEVLESNYLGWSRSMAPVIMANPEEPELSAELTESFCRTDPGIAKQFARVTFLSDNRQDLALLSKPALILQCSEDVIAPQSVGDFIHHNLPGSRLHRLAATGHCPHLSAPDETIQAIKSYLAER